MKYRLKIFLQVLCACAALAAVGYASSFLAKIAAPQRAEKKFGGRAAAFAVFGGYREAIASFVWLKAYLAWERGDYQKCLSNIELCVELDPENIVFWNLGASIIAFDTPHWLFGGGKAPQSVQKSIRRRQGALALEFLDRGLVANPKSRRLKLDKAIIYEKVFADKNAALQWHKAACDEGAPIYVVRDCANMLEECGRAREALDLLLSRAGSFDKSHPSYEFYLGHIKRLENKINSQKNMLAL
ncbi:MAG: hypothetical protein IKO42_02220 [Opitutales bacterium]|nr:hypothetical protein [Opitutales bacterium]